jgi:hypothetical protein
MRYKAAHVGWMVRVIALLGLLAGCARYASPEQRRCLHRCAQRNDACLLYAGEPAAIERCDQETSSCVHRCR